MKIYYAEIFSRDRMPRNCRRFTDDSAAISYFHKRYGDDLQAVILDNDPEIRAVWESKESREEAMSEKTIKQPMVVTTAPERIYLQIADDCYYEDQPFPEEHSDQITWCADSVESCEVPYIREDLAASKAQTVDVEAIRELVAEMRNNSDTIAPDTCINAWADKLADALPKDQ